MLGRDVNAPYREYRTWLVEDEPDFDGYYYTGLKSGSSPLEEIVAYQISDAQIDFNLPNPLSWFDTLQKLPQMISSSQLAVIDGYLYLFGGDGTDNILRAPVGNPYYWENTGYSLPTVLSHSQLAIIGDYVYLFGGKITGTTNKIYYASLSDPLFWTDSGQTLPKQLQNSQLALVGDYVYLFGGEINGAESDVIFRALVANPFEWSDTGATLPSAVHSSQIAIIGSTIYMFGGIRSNYPSTNIITAITANPLVWEPELVYTLPYGVHRSQFIRVGNNCYLLGPTFKNLPFSDVGIPGKVRILSTTLDNPVDWVDTGEIINGNFESSQLGVINDRIFLFGGNGIRSIFACHVYIKFHFQDVNVGLYRITTRDNLANDENLTEQFGTLSFQPWKTDYFAKFESEGGGGIVGGGGGGEGGGGGGGR